MSYHRETYQRDEDRNTGGGWKSWFGLGDDKDKNDYHYQRTTTYRNDDRDSGYNRGASTGYGGNYQTSTYVRDSDRDRGYTGNTSGYTGNSSSYDRGYSGGMGMSSDRGYTGGSFGDNRGGYGYQTSSEYNRGNDSSRGIYDRDNNRDYNQQSTYVRSYNSDRDTSRPSDSYSSQRYTSDNRGGYGGSSDTSRFDTGRTGFGGSYDTSRFGSSGNSDRDRYGGSYSYTSRSNNY